MRINEILNELKKKKAPKTGDTTDHDYNPGWEDLNWLKERGLENGNRMTGNFQLFMPRPNAQAITPRDKRIKNLSNKYAYDDAGEIKPQYDKYEQPRKELSGTGKPEVDVEEASPILKPGKATPGPGYNKPNTDLWTSTGKKTKDGWTSGWVQFAASNHRKWVAEVGYLYKVKPGAVILELNNDDDVERVYDAFVNLGMATPIDYDLSYGSPGRLTKNFPWDAIARHFDGVRHSGYSRDGFMYGWDVESTAWFNTSMLELVGEVNIDAWSDEDY